MTFALIRFYNKLASCCCRNEVDLRFPSKSMHCKNFHFWHFFKYLNKQSDPEENQAHQTFLFL